MQIYIYVLGGVVVSPGRATTSVGGILTLVSSSVFFPIFLLSITLFLSLSLPLSLLLLLFVLLGGASSSLMIIGWYSLVYL